MSNALAIYDEMDTPSLAEAMFKSGLFSDTKSLAQAIVKVIAGRELGLGPVTAMRGIDIIQGKVSLSASLTAALVKQTGRYTYYVVEHDEKVCRIEFHERDPITGGWSPIGTSTFTMDMARRANLEGKDVWRNYPEAMLWARAMTQGAGWFCPDATEGRFYTAEELGEDILDEPLNGHVLSSGADVGAQTGPGYEPEVQGEPAYASASPGVEALPPSPPPDDVPGSVEAPAGRTEVGTADPGDDGSAEEPEALGEHEPSSVAEPSSADSKITSEQIRAAYGGATPAAKATHAMFPNKSVDDLTQKQRAQLIAAAPKPSSQEALV